MKYKKKYIDLKRKIEEDTRNKRGGAQKDEEINMNRTKYVRLKREPLEYEKKSNSSDYTKRVKIYEYAKNGKYNDNNDCLGKEGKLCYIAEGGGGVVYKKRVEYEEEEIEVAIKTLCIEKYCLKKVNFMNPKFMCWKELDLLKRTTRLVLKGVTQNLPILYSYKICREKETTKVLLYNEYADGNLEYWLYRNHTEQEWKSFLFQFWSGLYVLQKYIQMVHNDLRLLNILYFDIPYEKEEYWKYTIEGEEYYVPNKGNVFTIWDYGSARVKNYVPHGKMKEIVDKAIKYNIDLVYIHDMYKRIKVLTLANKYTTTELEKYFIGEDRAYYEKTKRVNERRFTGWRFESKFKISLCYYMVEKGRYKELNKKKEGYLDPSKIIKEPPESINEILKELSTKYNLTYEERMAIYSPNLSVAKELPTPKELIKIYLSEYKEKKPSQLSFNI